MAPLLQLPTPYRDAAFVALELAPLLLAVVLVRLGIRIASRRLAATPEPSSGRVTTALRVFGALLLGVIAIGCLAVLGFNLFLLVNGEDIVFGTLSRVAQLPPELARRMAIAVGQAIALLVAVALVLRVVRWILRRVHRRVRSWERLTANDAAVDALFRLLGTAITTATWLATFAVLASWLPGSNQLSAVLLILLRIYLVFAVSMLLVRATAAVVDSLDALSAKYAGPQTPFRFYQDVRTLVPLLRRCLELAIWLAAASIMMLQVRPIAPFATYGPRLIQVVAIFFVGRVAAELVRLVIERTQGDRSGLTELEKQQRATLIPLVTSLGRAAVYFLAGVLMLSVLGFNPIPLLAGAGILGVVVGFGAQPVINDVVSGFFILAESQFLVGDYIEVNTARGVVEAIQLRTTKIRDPNGQLHIVRNGQLAGVVNYSKRYTFAVVEIELPYSADLDRASEALRSVGEELCAMHPDVLEPTTLEGLEKFGPSGVVLRTTTRVKPGTHGQVAREYRRRALEVLRTMGLAPRPGTVSS